MKDAAEELCREVSEEYHENTVCDTAVYCDGIWQRRGFASLNGVVTAVSIDTGKCLSYECLVKTCKACEMLAPRKGSVDYENFIKEHECPIIMLGQRGQWKQLGLLKFLKSQLQICNFASPPTLVMETQKHNQLLLLPIHMVQKNLLTKEDVSTMYRSE